MFHKLKLFRQERAAPAPNSPSTEGNSLDGSENGRSNQSANNKIIVPSKIDIIRNDEDEILVLMTYSKSKVSVKPSSVDLLGKPSKLSFGSIRRSLSHILKNKSTPHVSFCLYNGDREVPQNPRIMDAEGEQYPRPPFIPISIQSDANPDEVDTVIAEEDPADQIKPVDDAKIELRIPSMLLEPKARSNNVLIRYFNQCEEFEVEPLSKDILGVSIVSLNE